MVWKISVEPGTVLPGIYLVLASDSSIVEGPRGSDLETGRRFVSSFMIRLNEILFLGSFDSASGSAVKY
jgi:hypothetical protein